MSQSSRVDSIVAKWLTATRLRRYSAAFLVSSLIVATIAIALGDPPFNVFGRPLAEDFVHKAIGGRIVAAGRASELYDLDLQRTVEAEVLGRERKNELNPFVSPPFVAFVYAPIAVLPYSLAAGLWTLLAIALVAASTAALRALLPRLRHYDLATLLLVTFSAQPVLELLGAGQDSALSLAILTGSLVLFAADRDLAGGALLGVGVFKPQIFFLLPWWLALERRWRGLLGWSVVGGGLALASIGLVGLRGAAAYLALLESDFYREGIVEGLRWKMQSLPALAGALVPPGLRLGGGLATSAAFVAAGAVTMLVALRTARVPSAPRAGFELRYAFAILVGACVNPHFFIYDCTVLLVPALILLDAAPNDRRLWTCLAIGYLLLWTAPLRQALFGALSWPWSIPAAPWGAAFVAGLAVYAHRRKADPT